MIKEMLKIHEREASSKALCTASRDGAGNMRGGRTESCHSIDESITNIQNISWLHIPCCGRFTSKEIPCLCGLPDQITHEKKRKQPDYTWRHYPISHGYEVKNQLWKDKKWYYFWKNGIMFHRDWTLN